jgi:hypothetical protein
MRVVPVLLLAITACASSESSTAEPASVRERLATDTHLYITGPGSAGAVTAKLKTATGWDNGLVDLKLEGGQLIARAAPSGTITLTAVELGFSDITIPASVTGHAAVLGQPHLRLTAPADATTAWTDDNSAGAAAMLDLELSWTLTVDGVALPLGAPDLPAMPAKLELAGDGGRITAELRLHVGGVLWSWADLIQLSDLDLVLGADTPASTTDAPG